MKTKYLKEIGLSSEQIKIVMAENGKSIEKYKNFKRKFEEVEKQLYYLNKRNTKLEYELKLSEYIQSLNLKNDIYINALKEKIRASNLILVDKEIFGAENIVYEFKNKYPDAFWKM